MSDLASVLKAKVADARNKHELTTGDGWARPAVLDRDHEDGDLPSMAPLSMVGVQEDQVRLLHDMCRVGDTLSIEEFLFWMSTQTRLSYLNEGQVDIHGYHSAIVGARHDQQDVVRTLHAYGCDLGQFSSSGSSALHYAASLGSVHAAMALVDCGAPLDARDHEGWTPLHRAVHAGQLTLSRGLLESGADVNAGTTHGAKTALHLACLRGLPAMAAGLLEARASRGLHDKDGNLPLHFAAARAGEGCAELCARLLETDGADMNDLHCRNAHGDTALLVACAAPESSASALLLLNKGSNVLVQNMDGNTALHLVCAYGTRAGSEHATTALVEALLAGGADVDAQNKSGMTPLLLSCEAARAPEKVAKVRKEGSGVSKGSSKIPKSRGGGRAKSRGTTGAGSRGGSRGTSRDQDRDKDEPSSRQSPGSRSAHSKGGERGKTPKTPIEPSNGRGTPSSSSAAAPAAGVPHASGSLSEAFFNDDNASVGSLDSLGSLGGSIDSIGSIGSIGSVGSVGSVGDGDSFVLGGEGDAFVSVSVASKATRGPDFCNTVTLMLIRCGADVNKCHFDGRSPLFVTCSRGRAELAEILLDAGADPLATPLWLSRPSGEPRMDACPHVRDKIRQREQELLILRDAAEMAGMEDATRSMVLM